VIYFDNTDKVVGNLLHNTSGYSTTSATILNLEADSNGSIPKGVIAIQVLTTINDSASATTSGRLDLSNQIVASYGAPYYNFNSLPNDKPQYIFGWCPTDANGDVYYRIGASGAGTLDISSFKYQAVQVS
jgi:hypothetical protein